MSINASDEVKSIEKINKKQDLKELAEQGWFKVISSDEAGDYFLNVKYFQLIPNNLNQFPLNKSKWSKSVNVWIKTNDGQHDNEKSTSTNKYMMMLTNFNCEKKTIHIQHVSLFNPDNIKLNRSFSGIELQTQEKLVVPETINHELLTTSCFIRFLMID